MRLTLSVLMFLVQPAKAVDLDSKIAAEMEARGKAEYLKGEFISEGLRLPNHLLDYRRY